MTTQLTTLETAAGDAIAARNTLTPLQVGMVSSYGNNFYTHSMLPGLALRPLDKTQEKGYGCAGLALITADGGALILIGRTLARFFETGGKFGVTYSKQDPSGSPHRLQERIVDTLEAWVSASGTSSYGRSFRARQRIIPYSGSSALSKWPFAHSAEGTAEFCAFEVCTGATDGMVVLTNDNTVHVGHHNFAGAPDATGLNRAFSAGAPTLANGCLVKQLGLGSLHQIGKFSEVKGAIINSYPEDEGVRAWVAANYDRLLAATSDIQMGIEVFVTPWNKKAYIQGRRRLEVTATQDPACYITTHETVAVTSGVPPAVQSAIVLPYGYFCQPAGLAAGVHRNFLMGATECTWAGQMIEVTGMVLGPWPWSKLMKNLFLAASIPIDIGFIKTRLDGAFSFDVGGIMDDTVSNDISADPGGKYSPKA